MRYFLPFFLISALSCFSQKQNSVDFKKISASVSISPYSRTINTSAKYEFELIERVDTIYLNANDMVFDEVKLNGKKVKFNVRKDRLVFKAPKKTGKHSLYLKFRNSPSQTVYFINWNLPDSLKPSHKEVEGNKRILEKARNSLRSELFYAINSKNGQIWTQGQGKYTSHWLPSLDDMTDKIEFDLNISAENQFEVIANGNLRDKILEGDTLKWIFDMTNPMSSYLVAFVIGNFDKKVLKSKSDVPIELYYAPKDSLRFEPTYRYSKEIFDFMEAEIGVAYPWQNYKQVPVKDFLYAGMENTTCTIFSDQYVIDSMAFVDKNYVNVNAHELAHQWFGNLVTEESGDHHWLHEGFATYYAYLAEKKLFGPDHFYWKLYQTAKTLHNLSENEGGEALTDPNANSLTFYEKGAWALVALRDRVGDKAFKKGIQAYLRAYAYDNATIEEFLAEMEKASEMDLSAFHEKWLRSEEFPWLEAKDILIKNAKTLKTYFGLYASLKDDTKRFDPLIRLWDGFTSDALKMELIKDFRMSLIEKEFIDRLNDESVKVRQSFIVGMDSIPKEFQSHFEDYLGDESYITQEVSLFKLWQAFPEKRVQYLNALDDVDGLPNKNVRLLWLTLALITEDFRPLEKKAFFSELNSYTSSGHNFEIRQSAFQYLHQIGAMSDMSLKNLFDATAHHVWQFKKSSRNLVREINRTGQGKARLGELSLNEEEKERLNIILNP